MAVYSNDPQQPRLMLRLQGTVEVLAGFDPPALGLGVVAPGRSVARTATLVGRELGRLELRELRAERPELRARLQRTAGVSRLTVTFRAPREPGYFSGAITALTNLEQPRELRLPVWASVARPGAPTAGTLRPRMLRAKLPPQREAPAAVR